MCKGMVGDGSDTGRPSPVATNSEWKEPYCLSPVTPLSFSKFTIDTEWGEMEDYDDIAGGPLFVSPCMSSPGSYGFVSPTSSAQSWLDIRVVYVRVTGCALEEAPESLTIRFPPRSIGTALEVNGGRIPPSEEACVGLRRDRVDTETAEATYVSTDNLRISGAICYEVFNKDEALISGSVEHVESCSQWHGGYESLSRRSESAWTMECNCVIGQSGCVFVRSRHDYSAASLSLPAMEVCMVGRHLNTPVFLTQTVHLSARRRSSRLTTLDAIPETEELGKPHNGILVDQPHLITERTSFMDLEDINSFLDLSDKAAAELGCSLDGYVYGIEGEDGQMTWFNAGVRVGVGIGLGMCLGVGIGVGLMVRTYQATTRTFRRGLI